MLEVSLDTAIEERLEALGAKDQEAKASLARRVLRRALDELSCLEVRLEGEIARGLAGPSDELTERDWEEIFSTRPSDVDPESWAVPPGWNSARS